MGSITFLFMAQILSHSMKTTDLDEPWAKINCLRASMVRPRRRTPRTVGNLGSSQPSTLLLSTNQVSLRFDITYEQLIKRWKFVIIWMDGSVLKIQHYNYQLQKSILQKNVKTNCAHQKITENFKNQKKIVKNIWFLFWVFHSDRDYVNLKPVPDLLSVIYWMPSRFLTYWLSIWMVCLVLVEIQTSESLVLKCFQFSNGWY